MRAFIVVKMIQGQNKYYENIKLKSRKIKENLKGQKTKMH